MDPPIETQYPILSYVLLSQLDPASHPPPQLVAPTQYPHLPDPPVLSSLARSVPPAVAHTLSLLRSLGPRPGPDAVSRAAQMGESGPEAEMCRAVARLEEMHVDLGRQLRDVEERLAGAYTEAVAGGGGEVNEEVVAVLREVESGGAVESLDLSDRQLRIVPEAFGRIKGLLALNLSQNLIEVLPDSISGLEKLEQLDVSSNLLQSLPDSIGLLRNLKILHVSGNRLSKLPESIALCSSLVEIDASFNNLVSLPSNIGYGLANLERISIQLNKISLLPPSICEMKSLRYLDAHFNEIHGLPYAIGRLTSMEVLNLSSNFSDLTELPETIGDLVNLRELDLSNNQIQSLPETFGRLENLTKLNLDENPLVVPPREIVARGVEPVREFMIKMHLDRIAKEQERLNLGANQELNQPGWVAWGTSLLSNVVSGISERVSGYAGGPKAPSDPLLDQRL